MKHLLLNLARYPVWSLTGFDPAGFRWFRRAWGGHWERWFVDPCWCFIWLDDVIPGEQPPCTYGRPSAVEDYP